MVRVERIELSSQVWKTCILTVVLHSHILILPQPGGIMGWEIGIEPTTFWTTIRRSNQLSYSHHFVKIQTRLTCDSRQASSNLVLPLYQTTLFFTRIYLLWPKFHTKIVGEPLRVADCRV